MKKIVISICVVVLIAVVAFLLYQNGTLSFTTTVVEAPGSGTTATSTESTELLILNSPQEGDEITSPLLISGVARGYWFFEASFPIELTNWDGLIIAQGIGQAQGDWMTEEYVPFTATIEYTSPYHAGDPDFMKRGTLILHKDNPSGLPEHDAAKEINVWFESSK